MIIFNGEHSAECAKYICNLHRKTSMIVAILLFIVIELPLAIYSFFYFPFHWGVTLGLNVFLWGLINFLMLLPPLKSSYDILMPTSVSILDDGKIVSQGKKFEYAQAVENVTKVVDHGAGYELYLDNRQNRGYYICEKALLKTGTIDDFESLFAGKIVSKEERKGEK